MSSDNTSIDSYIAGPAPSRRRQARGERRIAQLLDAAADLFAEVGYEAATTNAIAARAGVSPGSLYQFFDNKEAMAEALAVRYVDQIRALHGPPERQPSPALVVDRMVDPIVAFNLANPAFQTLLRGPDVPSGVALATERLHREGLCHVDTLIAALAPELPAEDRRRRAVVCKHLAKGLLPVILAAGPPERDRLVAELKDVLRGYLGPLAGEPPG